VIHLPGKQNNITIVMILFQQCEKHRQSETSEITLLWSKQAQWHLCPVLYCS